MKIGVFSDLHLHNFSAFAMPGTWGLNSRAWDGLGILGQICDAIEEQDLEAVLFCGDMFEAKAYLSASLVIEAQKMLFNMTSRIPVIMIPGNHDLIVQDTEAPSALELFADINQVSILNRGMVSFLDNAWVMGFGAKDDISWPLSKNRRIKQGGILLLHKTFKNTIISPTGYVADEGASLSEVEAFMDKYGFKVCFCGDIHIRQQLKPNIWYVGSPLQQEFGESQDKGMLILNTDDWSVDYHPLHSPQFIRTKYIPYLNLDEDDYYSVSTSSPEEYEAAGKRFENQFNVKVEPPPKEIKKSRSNLTVDMAEDTVLREYVNIKAAKKDQTRLFNLGKQLLTKVKKGLH